MCAILFPVLIAARQVQETGRKAFFLVATPNMADPIFEQTVILMLPPHAPLIAGLIVNRPSDIPVLKVFPHARLLKNEPAIAYFGGPVYPTDPSLVLRDATPPATAPRLFDDVCVSTDPDSIAQLVKDSGAATDLRLILGRAQWSLDQLHSEIMEGSWYILPADADIVFSPKPKQVWHTLVERGQLQEVRLTPAPEQSALDLISAPPFSVDPHPVHD